MQKSIEDNKMISNDLPIYLTDDVVSIATQRLPKRKYKLSDKRSEKLVAYSRFSMVTEVCPMLFSEIRKRKHKLKAIVFTSKPHPMVYRKGAEAQGYMTGGRVYWYVAVYMVPSYKRGPFTYDDASEAAHAALHDLGHVRHSIVLEPRIAERKAEAFAWKTAPHLQWKRFYRERRY